MRASQCGYGACVDKLALEPELRTRARVGGLPACGAAARAARGIAVAARAGTGRLAGIGVGVGVGIGVGSGTARTTREYCGVTRLGIFGGYSLVPKSTFGALYLLSILDKSSLMCLLPATVFIRL